jgi:hypothetical protein
MGPRGGAVDLRGLGDSNVVVGEWAGVSWGAGVAALAVEGRLCLGAIPGGVVRIGGGGHMPLEGGFVAHQLGVGVIMMLLGRLLLVQIGAG